MDGADAAVSRPTGEHASHQWTSGPEVKVWLSEHFARETDRSALLAVALEAIGRFLGVSRVAYGEVDAAQEWMTVPLDWTNGTASRIGRRPFDPQSGFARHYSSGRPVVIADVDAADLTPDQREEVTATGIGAVLGVPLIDGGALVGVFNATHTQPRQWSEEEVLLVAQTGARLWGALQHLRTLERLRESEEQFRTLAENMPNLCWLAGPDSKPYWGNRKWYEFFADTGGTEGDTAAVVHPDDLPEAVETWRRALATGEPQEMRVRIRGAEGVYRTFLSSATPIRDHQGEVARWCGVLVDLSDHVAHDRRQAFLRRFSDRTRDVADAAAILATTSELLIAELGLSQVNYFEATEDEALFDAFVARPGEQLDAEATSFRFAEGFDMLLDLYRHGETLVVRSQDEELPQLTPAVRRARHALGMDATINVPLIKDGRLVALLSAADTGARDWTRDEIALVEELADRLGSSVSRARAEAALLDRERSQTFLVEWGDALRNESSPRALLAATLDMIGRHLDVARANYAEATVSGNALYVLQEWRNGVVSVVGQEFPLAALGEKVLADHLSGQPVRVDDISRDPRFDHSNRPLYEGIGVAAFLSVPLVRRGEIVGVLSMQQERPRRWTDREAELLRELADRTWSVLERALSEQRLADSEAQLAAFMENAPVAMHMKDADGRYVRINPEFARALGRPRDELQGAHPRELFPRAIVAQIERIERRALAGEAASAEIAFGPAGGDASVLATVFPIAGSGGVARTAGFTLDLTERKRAEAALARSREALYQTEKLSALGSMLAGVSHELNNPLSIVVAQAVMMERQSQGGELAERAQKIRKAAERCARIVQTFLAMARQKRPERRTVDLNAIVAAAHDLAEYSLRSDAIVSRRELTDGLPTIAADFDQLHQIVINLIVNAQQAMARHGAGERILTLRTARGPAPDTVTLEIADTGPGIPDDMRRRIFEPFFTTKPQGEGTGIGLSFSQGLAEAHGGRLELVPAARGACFRLTLPIEAAMASGEADAPAIASPLPPARRALVVDDEREIAEALADFLSLEGFSCDLAIGGVAAQDRIARGRYDLIVSDIRMPDLDGPQLHAWISRERPDLLDRVAFATGDTLGTAVAHFLDTVRRPVLEKPFTPESVSRFLDQMDLT